MLRIVPSQTIADWNSAAEDGAGRARGLGEPLPIRVGFVGARGRELLGGAVEAVELEGGKRREPEFDGGAGALDLIVIASRPEGLERIHLGRIADEARRAAVPVIGLDEGMGTSAWTGLEDLRVGSPGPGTLTAAPPVDPGTYNPMGFTTGGVTGFIAVTMPGEDPEAVEGARSMLAAAADREPVELAGDPELADLGLPGRVIARPIIGQAPRGLLRRLHRYLGVLDHPGFHQSDWERAGWIVRLAAGGVPVVAAQISPELAELLGPELAAVLEGFGASELADPDRRERISVALRRAALRHHSQRTRWRQIAAAAGFDLPPRTVVSIIFSTRREDWLEHGLAQVNRQSYEPRELVVCLHGDDFSEGIEERVRALAEGPLKMVRVDSELTLGEALNQGVAAASGELVTKMDDDDYYNVDHLWDLVLAFEYSRADLVGKAAEFVYLEEVDVLVRQYTKDVDTRLAGGGMMIRREALVELGGWPARTRGEDLAIIRMFNQKGRPIHRIPPHGYILNRHGRDHTWGPRVDYFLFRSQDQWRGLRLDVTAIEPPPVDLRPGR